MNNLLFGFRSVVIKECLHLRRDLTTFVIALLIPMVQLTIFGYAADYDVRHIATVVIDYDRSQASREYLTSLVNSQYVDIVQYATTPDQAVAALRRGSARIAVIIPPDFGRLTAREESNSPSLSSGGAGGEGAVSHPQVRILIDGSDSQIALRARQASLGVGARRPSTSVRLAHPRRASTPASIWSSIPTCELRSS